MAQSGARPAAGMAVVSVLLVVAVIALLAAALMARQTTVIRSAQAEQTHIQARWLLRGELSRARVVLGAEAQRTPVTRLDGVWATPVNGVVAGELEGEAARLFGEIRDEQSRFNLLNLANAGQPDPRESAAFLRLCALTGVPRSQAVLIVRRVVSSLSEAAPSEVPVARAVPDQEMIVTDPRETAPRLREVSDLLATPGLDPASVERLRPYITLLPQRTWINANTAGPEVLAAWVPGLTLEHARAMLAARDHGQWFRNRGDFVSRLAIAGINESDIFIGITSQWFRVDSAVRTSRITLVMQALLHDDKTRLPRVVWLREGA